MESQIDIKWPFNYQSRGDSSSERLLILLHGYQQSGKWMHRRFEELEFDGQVIAPNGLFPVPFKGKFGWQVTYSWYFYEPESNVYVIEMDRGIDYLLRGLAPHLVGKTDVRIIGFSQGGYMAPFLARSIEQSVQAIGVCCRFRSEKLKEKLSFRLDAIHGEDDQLVDLPRAKSCFDEIIGRGNRGEFIKVKGLGHDVDTSALRAVSSLLATS